MVRFFVLDEAGDHELAFELDDYGEESYYIPGENLSADNLNIKKFFEIETFDDLKKITGEKLFTCKIPTYPEVFLASIRYICSKIGKITFKSGKNFDITSEFVVFKERKYLFVQPLKYAPSIKKNRIIVCFTVSKDYFDDEKFEISELPRFSFTTNGMNYSKIGNVGSWSIVFNSEYIENNGYLSEYIVKKYKIRKYQDLKNQKEFYFSRPLEDINDVLLTEPCFNEIVLTLVEVEKDEPLIPYGFDCSYSGWYFTVFPFISFVQALSHCEATSISARFFHLCQSSGHGKTRLCFELLKFMERGAYCVYRSGTGFNENGFPKTTPWMRNLIDAFNRSNCDLDSMLICSQFLVAALKSFNSPSADRMEIFDGQSITKANEITSKYFNLNFLFYLSEFEKTKTFNSNIADIEILCNDTIFPVIFDECYQMLRVPSNNPESISLYRAMRRVLCKIRHTKVVAVFLGTKSSLSDFDLKSRRDSSSSGPVGDEKDKCEIPVYIFTQSVDAMFNKPFFICYEGCYHIRNIGGSRVIIPLDLKDIARNFGRPLWARYSFQKAAELALEKLKTDLSIFELTCLIMRIGTKVVPKDELAHKLVLSEMATLIKVDVDGSYCLVEYIPEPILSNAARIALTKMKTFKKAIKEYVRYLQLGSFYNSGSAGEIVGRIVLLRAMDLTILKRKIPDHYIESNDVVDAFMIETIFGGDQENLMVKGLKFAEWSERISKLRREPTDANYVSPKLSTETVELSAETSPKDIKSSSHFTYQDYKNSAGPSSTTILEETISVDDSTVFFTPLIGASTVREFLMFLSDLTDASSLKNLGVSDEVLDGLVCFNQFVQMDHPLKVNQQVLLHFFARSSALILADGSAGADLKIPVLRTDNKMSCISIQIKNYGVSTLFPHKSSETTSKFKTENMKFFDLGPIADFEEVHKDDFVRIVIQFNGKGYDDQVLRSEDTKNIEWVNIPNSVSQASNDVNQASRRKVQCQALWIRGLECFRPLFFDDESLIKDLNIILSGRRDFLYALEFPKITQPTTLQTTEIGARVLADCARPLATFNNVINHDTNFHDATEYSDYKSKLEALSIPSFADEFMNNRTLTTDKNLVKNDIVESHSGFDFDSAPKEWQKEMIEILSKIRAINYHQMSRPVIIKNNKNKNANNDNQSTKRIREISDDDNNNNNKNKSNRNNTNRGG